MSKITISSIGSGYNDAEWRYIEFVASWLLEGGKPHCIPSIED